ncbi:hypothetical protein TSUD_228740 [Trifolium subterraneum]|uniref:Uncharacterized protein n=1 Tax=Trifolium subterraneum TaxID=3900 RepID=A0A2Z6LMH7_TRISU|nr:hypothetical protein TSUD_228740 [Trifolium subterraneum]
MISDSCRSGAIIEGANEIIGHSTYQSVSDRRNAPRSRFLQARLNEPSGRYLGVLITACQSDQSTTAINGSVNSRTYFLPILMSVITRMGVHISNYTLVSEIASSMANSGRMCQTPGLYCHPTQMSLEFLSLKKLDEPEFMDIDPGVAAVPAASGGEILEADINPEMMDIGPIPTVKTQALSDTGTHCLYHSLYVKRVQVPHATVGPDEPHAASTTCPDGVAEKQDLSLFDSELERIEEFLGSELPSHPKLHRGQLKNGLRYLILPNKVPPTR